MPIRIKINGIEVSAEPGTSVLDAVRRFGVHIPTLCHHEAVEDIGACRICLVELKQGKKTEVTTSCNAKVAEGMEVNTDTAEVKEHRAANIEMLLGRAPGSRVVRQLATDYGIHESRFVPEESGGLEGCILCELCVRVCESLGHSALAVVGRGGQKRVGAPFDKPSDACVGCAACLSVCPTDCIPMEEGAGKRKIWDQEFPMIACDTCGAHFITEKHKSHAVAKGPLADDYYTTCTVCKKRNLASHFAHVGS